MVFFGQKPSLGASGLRNFRKIFENFLISPQGLEFHFENFEDFRNCENFDFFDESNFLKIFENFQL